MILSSYHLLFFLSGAAGLGYEILWTRMFAVSLGHESISMLAVLCALFAGLALGAAMFDRPVARSRKPERWYIGFEVMIGFWAIVLIVLIPLVNPLISSLITISPPLWRHWLVAFGLPFLLLLPATAAMGGTLAAMDRYVGKIRSETSLAGLYGANTFGAVAGTLCTLFFCCQPQGSKPPR